MNKTRLTKLNYKSGIGGHYVSCIQHTQWRYHTSSTNDSNMKHIIRSLLESKKNPTKFVLNYQVHYEGTGNHLLPSMHNLIEPTLRTFTAFIARTDNPSFELTEFNNLIQQDRKGGFFFISTWSRLKLCVSYAGFSGPENRCTKSETRQSWPSLHETRSLKAQRQDKSSLPIGNTCKNKKFLVIRFLQEKYSKDVY